MDYTTQVTEALNKLGATSADIAATLENKGIRGLKRRAEHCAITVYLAEQFPELTGIRTGSGRIIVVDAQCVLTPESVGEFVADFDAGKYPNLVAS